MMHVSDDLFQILESPAFFYIRIFVMYFKARKGLSKYNFLHASMLQV